jgi:hypothetical protein
MDLAIDVLAEDLVVEELSPSAQTVTIGTLFTMGTFGCLTE